METLNTKRARLRHELRSAYDAWMGEHERHGSPFAEPVDISGGPVAAGSAWLEYLEAKQRLVAAYAELPVAA